VYTTPLYSGKASLVTSCSQFIEKIAEYWQKIAFCQIILYAETMDNLQKVTEHIEYLFLKQIIKGLRDESITPEQAKEFAQKFLPIEPFQSLDDAKQKIHSYVAAHEQFRPLQDYVDAFHVDLQADQKVEQMKQFIKENRFDEAIQVAKG